MYLANLVVHNSKNSKNPRLTRNDAPPHKASIDFANIDAGEDDAKNVDEVPDPTDVDAPGCIVDASNFNTD